MKNCEKISLRTHAQAHIQAEIYLKKRNFFFQLHSWNPSCYLRQNDKLERGTERKVENSNL